MAKKRRRGRGEGAVFFSEAKGVWIGRAVVGARPDGGPRRCEVTAHTKEAVLRKVRLAEERARQAPADAARVRLGDYLRHWLDNVAKPAVEPTTWETYESAVRLHLVPRLGALTLAGVTPQRVEGFLAALHADGVRGGYAAKIVQILATALRHAARVGAIASPPTAGAARPRVPEREIHPFTPDEVRLILAAATGRRYHALFALAFATGARMGELIALTWGDVDLDKRTMRVERSACRAGGTLRVKAPKSRRGRRTVELPGFAVEALAAHRARMLADGNGAATVFCTRRRKLLDGGQLRTLWRAVLLAAGVPYRKFHNTRHTHASQLLASGVSITEVARRIGDRPETVLRVYSHHMPTDSKVPTLLEALYGRQGGDKVEGPQPGAGGQAPTDPASPAG